MRFCESWFDGVCVVRHKGLILLHIWQEAGLR